jgi:hypothetical protein
MAAILRYGFSTWVEEEVGSNEGCVRDAECS